MSSSFKTFGIGSNTIVSNGLLLGRAIENYDGNNSCNIMVLSNLGLSNGDGINLSLTDFHSSAGPAGGSGGGNSIRPMVLFTGGTTINTPFYPSASNPVCPIGFNSVIDTFYHKSSPGPVGSNQGNLSNITLAYPGLYKTTVRYLSHMSDGLLGVPTWGFALCNTASNVLWDTNPYQYRDPTYDSLQYISAGRDTHLNLMCYVQNPGMWPDGTSNAASNAAGHHYAYLDNVSIMFEKIN